MHLPPRSLMFMRVRWGYSCLDQHYSLVVKPKAEFAIFIFHSLWKCWLYTLSGILYTNYTTIVRIYHCFSGWSLLFYFVGSSYLAIPWILVSFMCSSLYLFSHHKHFLGDAIHSCCLNYWYNVDSWIYIPFLISPLNNSNMCVCMRRISHRNLKFILHCFLNLFHLLVSLTPQ